MRFAGGGGSRLLLCICGAVAAIGAAAGPAGASGADSPSAGLLQHPGPAQIKNFSFFRSKPEPLPERLRRALGPNLHSPYGARWIHGERRQRDPGLNPDLAQRIAALPKTKTTLWAVPGRRSILIFQANMELGKFGTTRSAVFHGLGAHWQSGYWPGQNEAVGIVPDGVTAVEISSTVKVRAKRNTYSAYGDLGEIWDHPRLIWGPERANRWIASKRPRTRSGLLWGRAFVATSADDRDRPKKPPITEPSDVRVSFSTSRGHHWIGWKANCNSYGGRVKARHNRLIPSELVGTTIACPGPPAREDRWLEGLFEAKPHWSLRGSQLRLWAGSRHMTLIEKT